MTGIKCGLHQIEKTMLHTYMSKGFALAIVSKNCPLFLNLSVKRFSKLMLPTAERFEKRKGNQCDKRGLIFGTPIRTIRAKRPSLVSWLHFFSTHPPVRPSPPISLSLTLPSLSISRTLMSQPSHASRRKKWGKEKEICKQEKDSRRQQLAIKSVCLEVTTGS
jgi:hypothetical protein